MPSDTIILFGVNHKTTPIEVREKIALAGNYPEHLAALFRIEGVKECYILSTCNRVELLVISTIKAEEMQEKLGRFLFRGSGDAFLQKNSVDQFSDYVYMEIGEKAVRHFFTVASSLDSMVVGEAQILGQIKDAYRYAAEEKTTGVFLNKLLHKSFTVAKRVRTETGIGAAAVSISYAAVQLAGKIFGNLQGKNVLLIGAGEMAELAAEHLVGQQVAGITVANRTLERAMALAQRLTAGVGNVSSATESGCAGKAISMEELPEHLEKADIIISSTGAPSIIIRLAEIQSVMKVRRNRPLFLIDIAVPRDLDPQLNTLDNVYLYDIDDLSGVVDNNKKEREREAVKAQRIVFEETIKFTHYIETLSLTPTILELRQQIEEMVRSEVQKTSSKIEKLSTGENELLNAMAHSIAAKILHQPMEYLKSNRCLGKKDIATRIHTVREMFALEGNTREVDKDSK